MNILVTINTQYINQLNILLNSIQKSNRDKEFNIYIINKDLTQEQIEKIKKRIGFRKISYK